MVRGHLKSEPREEAWPRSPKGARFPSAAQDHSGAAGNQFVPYGGARAGAQTPASLNIVQADRPSPATVKQALRCAQAVGTEGFAPLLDS